MTACHSFDPTILREYDIRGVVGRTLHGDDARALGRAFGSRMRASGARLVAVGYDGRLSSPELAAALVDGLTASGVDVVRIGLGPTPMLYFATHHLPTDAGVMVTGSHNPPDYNGFKMTLGEGSVYGEAIQELGRIAEKGEWAEGQGEVSDEPVFDAYVERLMQESIPEIDKLSVAWDAGNGAAGEAMVALCQKLPGRHLLLNERIDGTFPAHHPDPTVPENLSQLIELVAREGCDLGIAFDGDGDRIGVVDEKGRVLWGDQIMLRLARGILKAQPGATFIADVKASQVLFDEITRAGGRAIMWKTGHSLIKAKMKEEQAAFAGEMSAHLFFADRYYGYDDALYAAVRLLADVASSGESLADFRDSLPPVVNTPEIRFPCSEERKWAVIQEVRARLEAEGADLVTLDGVRVRCDDGWWLLRASNTQDVLVARCEADDEAGLARQKQALRDQLEACGLDLPDF
jgi:phosphomannomutase